jgi:hypothetical protein
MITKPHPNNKDFKHHDRQEGGDAHHARSAVRKE